MTREMIMTGIEEDYAVEQRAKGVAIEMYAVLAAMSRAPGTTILFKYQERIDNILDKIQVDS